MSMQTVPRLVRRLAWAQAELVEGCEALLWPATGPEAAEEELPDRSRAFRAVVSWVRPQIIRFETAAPEPLPQVMLVSALAVGGPAQFVVRKTYQVGNTAAYEPPAGIYVVERREFFRAPVAVRLGVEAPGLSWSGRSLDLSQGGLRFCLPAAVEVGTELTVTVGLQAGRTVALAAVVRHSRPYFARKGRVKPGEPVPGTTDASPSVVGVQFLNVAYEAERRLNDFLSRHQRRLVPRLSARIWVEYCPEGRVYYLEALGSELSPGDLVFQTRKPYLPGARMKVKVHLGRKEFEMDATLIDCRTTVKDDGTFQHEVKASFDDCGPAQEPQFRKAVRDLVMEMAARRY